MFCLLNIPANRPWSDIFASGLIVLSLILLNLPSRKLGFFKVFQYRLNSISASLNWLPEGYIFRHPFYAEGKNHRPANARGDSVFHASRMGAA
jgi:hypothetical protein